jgi:hypothetical protein
MKEDEKFVKHVLVHSVFVFIVELIKLFGLETILIYTALLLKKRIVVYHHSLEALLKVSSFDKFWPSSLSVDSE